MLKSQFPRNSHVSDNFLLTQVPFCVQNASRNNILKQVLKSTKNLKSYKWLKLCINLKNHVFIVETNFHVIFGMSDNCPISEAIARARLIGSGIF